mmetsp:Transcript_56436/g.125982  ORF Transcript_56436/g.125982 Transcript_56436/m.125982 type:complete len:96 (+) Transcript_56436:136-423(+)
MFNDEVDMLRFRLNLHAPVASTFVVVQSNLTFSGKPKELYAQRVLDEAVASDQVRQRRIVLTVPTPPTPAHTPWDRERFQRTFLLKWLQRHYADH